MKPMVITEDLATIGMRVMRGPSWAWGDQDGGIGGKGTITKLLQNGWVMVKWDNSTSDALYRVGHGGDYDLVMYDPFTSTGINLANPYSKRVSQANQALQSLSESIKKTTSLTEKSNTKHGNTNTGSGSNRPNPIKVRRPISTIEGSKRRSRAPIKCGRGSARS